MTTNLERRAQIFNLQNQLKIDLANLEKQYRQDRAQLEHDCDKSIRQLEREIKECSAREIRDAQDKIRAIIRESGVDPALLTIDAIESKSRKPMAPSKVRHVGPEGQVWNGRGRMPYWYRQRLAEQSQQGGDAS